MLIATLLMSYFVTRAQYATCVAGYEVENSCSAAKAFGKLFKRLSSIADGETNVASSVFAGSSELCDEFQSSQLLLSR